MDFRGRRLILTISCIYIDFDLFLKIWLAGLAGWLLAAGWMVRRRDSRTSHTLDALERSADLLR